MLEVFHATFPTSNDFEALKPTLQKINDAILRRDFDAAFGNDEYLEAYAIRWSPSRALGYAQLLAWICADRADDFCISRLVRSGKDRSTAKVVCFGGGAAEMMAFAGLLRHLQPAKAAGRPGMPAAEVSDSLEAMSISTSESPAPLLHLNLVDVADWSPVLSKLGHGLKTPPTLSKYASATARAANTSFLLSGTFEHTFTCADVLDYGTDDLRTMIATDPALITFMFTLNELYMTSMPRTTAFLRRLTEATPKGTLLLVVDIPGVYSEVAVDNANEGGETRRYPMSRLLDYALLPNSTKKSGSEDSDDEEPERAWEKVTDEPAMSYRLEQGLKYPVSLENMKFQVHLFKRV